jgi:hypothetical protein
MQSGVPAWIGFILRVRRMTEGLAAIVIIRGCGELRGTKQSNPVNTERMDCFLLRASQSMTVSGFPYAMHKTIPRTV